MEVDLGTADISELPPTPQAADTAPQFEPGSVKEWNYFLARYIELGEKQKRLKAAADKLLKPVNEELVDLEAKIIKGLAAADKKRDYAAGKTISAVEKTSAAVPADDRADVIEALRHMGVEGPITIQAQSFAAWMNEQIAKRLVEGFTLREFIDGRNRELGDAVATALKLMLVDLPILDDPQSFDWIEDKELRLSALHWLATPPELRGKVKVSTWTTLSVRKS